MVDFEQCPFLDDDDPRCGRVLRLERVNDAFQLCLDTFPQCAMYRIMTRSRKGPTRVSPAAVTAGSA